MIVGAVEEQVKQKIENAKHGERERSHFFFRFGIWSLADERGLEWKWEAVCGLFELG